MKKLISFAFLFFVPYSLQAQQMPNVISYQGVIQSVNGVPVQDSTYPVTVIIWTDADAGTPIWQDVFNAEVRGGVFNILLGSHIPLPASSAMDHPLWISVSVGEFSESSRRTMLSSVPMAMNVTDSAITTKKLADGAVTWNKMGTDYVPYIRVNGAKVNTGQSSINFTGGDGLKIDYDSTTMSVIVRPDVASTADNPGTGNLGNGMKTLTIGNSWVEGGNSDIDSPSPSKDYLGTKTNDPVWFKVNTAGSSDTTAGTVMRYVPTSGEPNIIGGNASNTNTGHGSVIAGGGYSGAPNTISNDNATISGGSNNNVIGEWGTIGGGQNGNVYSIYATVGGGVGNTAGHLGTGHSMDQHQTVGGGNTNLAQGDDAVVAGGENNSATGGHTAIGGGFGNTDTATGGVVSGGESNTSFGDHASVVGGDSNTTLGSHSAVLGGIHNYVSGKYSSVLGGQWLDLGDSSIGFNAAIMGTSLLNLTAFQNVGYFGNIDLWIGNMNDAARELRFYGPNHDLHYATSMYSAFKAGVQTDSIVYTLPTTAPTAGQLLEAYSVSSGTNVALSWVTGGGGSAGWLLTGNAGTNSGTNYLGTNDTAAFEIHLDNLDPATGGNHRVMKYSQGIISPNLLGGSRYNSIAPGLSGNAIMGGGDSAMPNMIMQATSTFGYPLPANLNFIGGGEGNVTWSEHDVIGGGRGNMMMADTFRSGYNFIGGGDSNFVGWGCYDNVIGGGRFDTLASSYGVISGGELNLINGPSTLDFIGGGIGNDIGGVISVNGNANYSAIVGGDSNTIMQYASYSSIVGGSHNVIDSAASYNFLGSGFRNHIDVGSDTSALVGGANNYIGSGMYSFLGAGANDTIKSSNAFLGGGQNNAVESSSDHSVLSGGQSNTIKSDHGTISGGSLNNIGSSASFSTVSGGDSNRVLANFSNVSGGYGNTIANNLYGLSSIGGGQNNYVDTSAYLSTIGGGAFNFVLSYWSTIGGGELNLIDRLAPASTIGGGQINKAFANYSTIGGGFYNLIERQTLSWCDLTWKEPTGTIAGGAQDTIGPLDTRWVTNDSLLLPPNYSSPVMASIGGGYKNTVNGSYGSVGGGYINHALGMGATVPGGIGLEATDLQTAVGRYNKNTVYNLGYLLGAHPDTIPSLGNAITFMVGNGTDTGHRSNAFTVSDVGYSTAYDTLSSGGAQTPPPLSTGPTVMGSTYLHNTIIAWGNAIPGAPADKDSADMGVASIQWVPADTQYVVTLNVNDPNGLPHHFTQGHSSVVASINQGLSGTPGIIAVTSVDASSTFRVTTWPAGSTHPTDTFGFMFQVVAR